MGWLHADGKQQVLRVAGQEATCLQQPGLDTKPARNSCFHPGALVQQLCQLSLQRADLLAQAEDMVTFVKVCLKNT